MSEKRLTFWMVLAFLTLAENGNVTKSASIINISQSGFSKLIKNLEKIFSGKLFSRSAGVYKLTADGELFRKFSINIINAYKEIDLGGKSCAQVGAIGSSRGISERQVEIFLTMVDLRNFSKTAKTLGLAQPSVSRYVKSLEDAFQMRLFERGSGDGVFLTQGGRDLFPKLRKLFDAYLKATDFIGARRAGCTDFLRIVVDFAISAVIEHEVKREFSSVEQRKLIAFTSAAGEDVVNRVARCDAEIGICGELTLDADVYRQKILEAPFGLLVPPGLDINYQMKSVNDMVGMPIVCFAGYMPNEKILQNECVDFFGYLQKIAVYANVLAAFDCMRKNRQCALVPSIFASNPEAIGMSFYSLDELLPMYEVYFLSNKKFNDRPKIKNVRDRFFESARCSNWHSSVKLLI